MQQSISFVLVAIVDVTIGTELLMHYVLSIESNIFGSSLLVSGNRQNHNLTSSNWNRSWNIKEYTIYLWNSRVILGTDELCLSIQSSIILKNSFWCVATALSKKG